MSQQRKKVFDVKSCWKSGFYFFSLLFKSKLKSFPFYFRSDEIWEVRVESGSEYVYGCEAFLERACASASTKYYIRMRLGLGLIWSVAYVGFAFYIGARHVSASVLHRRILHCRRDTERLRLYIAIYSLYIGFCIKIFTSQFETIAKKMACVWHKKLKWSLVYQEYPKYCYIIEVSTLWHRVFYFVSIFWILVLIVDPRN